MATSINGWNCSTNILHYRHCLHSCRNHFIAFFEYCKILYTPLDIHSNTFLQISEHIIDYTNCNQTINNADTGIPCSRVILENPNSVEPCMCRYPFRLAKSFEGKVYMYYGLTNFYQNHRRYVKSRDDNQLLGEFGSVSSDCAPFDRNGDKMIVPCGAIANSLFNDTLILHSDANGAVPTLNTGIAWESDKEIKFRNPPNLKEGKNIMHYDVKRILKCIYLIALQGTSRPIAWRKELWELDINDTNNNGLQNEDLIVWMRTAALPSFRKLYRRVDHSNSRFKNGLISGNYHLDIVYSEYLIKTLKFDSIDLTF